MLSTGLRERQAKDALVLGGLEARAAGYGTSLCFEHDILESYEEHHVAGMLCMDLAMMESTDERFDAKMTVLIESVSRHIDEEEQDWFPRSGPVLVARSRRRSASGCSR
jgi:hypothetical protein